MDRAEAPALLARLHSAQNSFYSGGDEGELPTLLAPDITCPVPGRNLIAGTYRSHGEVIGYFTRRRDLAANTFQITSRDVLTGVGDVIAALADGEATLAGTAQRWSIVGLYRERRFRVTAASRPACVVPAPACAGALATGAAWLE